MVSVGRHKNIELLAYSEVEKVSGYVGNYDVRVRRKARYIDEQLCTGCGQCAEACPVEIPNPFELDLATRKAAYRYSPQAVPGSFTIEKRGVAPCRDACPTDQRAQGYIALIRAGRFVDAYWAIRRENPFPSVCGRVCNHRCEEACSRGQVGEPVNIMALKRFVSDWAYAHRHELEDMRDKSLAGTPFQEDASPTGKRVAIIGAGPAGLTAGLDLVRLGHQVKIFDSLPVAGGMMRVGIPPHRLPAELLDWEIEQILAEGIELELNTWVDDIPGLLNEGFDSVLIASGAHQAKKLSIRNANHPDNWMSLDLLQSAALGEAPDLSGKKVVVLGGGNVALDAARTALRLGEPRVSMVCLEPRGEMPGFDWEIAVAEEEGIKLYAGRTFKEVVVKDGKIRGIQCVEVEFHGFKGGRPKITEIPGSDHIIPADLIIWAIGQGPDFSFLPQDGSVHIRYPVGVVTNEEMMTSMPGVFCAGDVRRGMTFFVVDAIGEGHHVARSIDRYLRAEDGLSEPHKLPVVELSVEEINAKLSQGNGYGRPRVPIQSIPLEERRNNFNEVDLTLTESEAMAEAGRCLECGICSECLECVSACERGAIQHGMQDQVVDLKVGAIILATGFQDFDPTRIPELGYGRLENVLSAMEFERLINTGGPTDGKVLLANGERPRTVAILHCVGSRDERFHKQCSRVCCMYSLKLAQLVHDYVDAEVHEIYRDMRTAGPGYEDFFNRTRQAGVHFHHGKVTSVERRDDHLRVRWDEAFHGERDHVDVDMVILATGFEPQPDSAEVAALFGISRSPSGFFLERHPKLAPIETATQGIFIAGACQSPKDIPDSVAQAGGAVAAALSLIDQGSIALEPSVAIVNSSHCAGCGQCAESCPYEAITIADGIACVNEYLCKGCGTCAGACPNKAVTLIHYDDQQILSEMISVLRRPMATREVEA